MAKQISRINYGFIPGNAIGLVTLTATLPTRAGRIASNSAIATRPTFGNSAPLSALLPAIAASVSSAVTVSSRPRWRLKPCKPLSPFASPTPCFRPLSFSPCPFSPGSFLRLSSAAMFPRDLGAARAGAATSAASFYPRDCAQNQRDSIMTVDCRDLEQFLAVIAGLVREGIGFRADAGNLRISLTGSH